ncbi:MAG: DUF2272 domain-containing protein [Actinomycetota bacterium]
MLWEADLARYPLVLCGPILRRVTPTSVAVFVVLTEHRWIQLRLYDAPTTFHDDQPVRVGPIVDTVRLGEHFFVGLATLDLAAGESLDQGAAYAYNVFFHTSPTGTTPEESLAQHDLHLLTLDNPHRIGFGHEQLPSFVVPPGDLAELRILQGSCRKPHGMGIDMLASFDDVLADGDAPRADRPHLLILGGDQIYADDVSPPLLRMIHDASQVLLGWHEELDGTAPHAPFPPAVSTLETRLHEWIDERTQDDGAWATDATKADVIDALNQVVALLDDAIANATFSDSSLRNQWQRAKLRTSLFVLKTAVERAIQEADLPAGTAETARDALDASLGGIEDWLETYEQIFLPLATNREWGRVALMNDPAELPKLAEVRDRLGALADSAGTDVAPLIDEFVAAFDSGPDGDFDSADARALRDSAVALGAELAQHGLLGAAEIKDLAGRYKNHFFPGERENGHYRPSRISAPQRGLELKQFASMTSDAMDAHLMFFGEFLLMYVFAWSDAVWPQIGTGTNRRFQLPPFFESVPNYGLTGPLGPSGLNDAAETLLDFAADLPKVRRVLANVPTLMMFDDHEITDDWNLNEDWLLNVNTKPAGAQLLRNGLIAYGIFQDWGNQPDHYLDSGTGDTRPIGRRLLDAVTYVPADPSDAADAEWDVDTPTATAAHPDEPARLKPPRLFRDTDPMNPESAVAEVNSLLGVGPQQMSQLTGLTADSVFTDAEDEIAYLTVPDTNRKQWDWSYDIPPAAVPDATTPIATIRPVRIISLDTRTRRGFPDSAWAIRVGLTIDGDASIGGKIAAASLIHGAELTRQLDDRLEPEPLHIVISPAPVFGLPLIEDVFQRLSVLNSGPEIADFEAWQANPVGFEMLRTSLRSADCVLVSGDVHYAYSNLISFPESESSDGAVVPPKLLLQLCSSSMKNETGLTQLLGAIGRDGRLIDFIVPALFEIGEMVADAFADLGDTLSDLGSDLSNFGTWWDETAPLLNPLNPGAWATYYLKLKDASLFSLNVPTPAGLMAVGTDLVAFVVDDLFTSEDGVFERNGFQMNFLSDDRSPAERRLRAAQLNGRPSTEIIAAITPGITGTAEQSARADELLEEMAEVVGYNNVGLITFTGPGTAADDVQHELLWHPHGSDNEPIETSPLVVASTLHGTHPPLASLPARIAEFAMEEYRIWNPPSGAIKEDTDEGERILTRYKDSLLPYDARLQAEAGRSLETFELVHAWSAIFISYVMHRAQATDWLFSQLHIDYARFAYRNGVEGNNNPFRFYTKDAPEAIVRVGDVVGGQIRGRPPGTTPEQWDEGVSDANIAYDLFEGKLVATHFDIVVEIDEAQHKAWIVGGNLGHTSKRDRIDLTAEGRLTGGRYGLIRAEVR